MRVLSRLAPAWCLSRTKCASASVRIFFILFRCAAVLLCISTSGFSTFVQSSVVDGASLATASSDVSSRLRMELYRSSYHFQPAKNWMNDPNGPMFYKGLYHLFYQYNPAEPVWGNLTWGHAVSEDLIRWEDLEPALTCDHWYDVGGVWSGSTTIRPDGTPMILYTGVAADLEETQNIAVPANASDPYLRDWVKLPENPVLRHPVGIDKEDFRDPTTAWQLDDGSWRMTLGARLGKNSWGQIGMALLYRSDDLLHWELEKNVLRALPQTGMWECLDFFPVGSSGQIGLDTSSRGPAIRHILKVSSFDLKRDYYAVGFYNEVTETFTPVNGELDLISGLLYDYGKFYASKSFFDPKKLRRINWGWSNESDTEAQDIAKGWASLMAIPRTMWLDNKLGDNLLQAPIEEVKSLRGEQVSKTDVELETGSILKIDGASGGQLDVEVVFEYPDVSKVSPDEGVHADTPFDCSNGGSAQQGIFGPFGLLVMADEALLEQTAVFFYISQSKGGRWATHFCSDQSRSSLLDGVDSSTYWGTVRVFPSEDFLSLRVLVDHSIVESFVQEGRMAVTSRVYPTKAIHEQAHVFLFNNGTSSITVRRIDIWKMRDAWTTPDTPVGSPKAFNPRPFNPKPFNPKPFNGAKK